MEPQRTPTDPKPSSSFIKYSSLGFQLFGSIGVAGWLGYLLDEKTGLKFPVFLLSFVLLMFAGNIYLIMRSFNKE